MWRPAHLLGHSAGDRVAGVIYVLAVLLVLVNAGFLVMTLFMLPGGWHGHAYVAMGDC